MNPRIERILRLPSPLLLPLLLAACAIDSHPEEAPWCTMAVPIEAGLLYPTGVLVRRQGGGEERRYLPVAREEERVGLALARCPDGRIRVCDILLWGPADRAGLRPGQVIARDEGGMKEILARLARRGGPVRIEVEDRPRTLQVQPGRDLKGHSRIALPLLFYLSGDRSRLDFALPLNLAGLSWRRVEAEPGKPVHRMEFSLLFGLLRF